MTDGHSRDPVTPLRRLEALLSFYMSETISELAKALAKAQGQLEPAVKNANNPHFKSKYADLESCFKAARSALVANGISVSQHPGFLQPDTVTLRTVMLHVSGEHMSSETAARIGTVTPQAIGSATTYLKRQAYCAIVGIATTDDDAEAASIEPAPVRKPAPVAASTPAAQTAPAASGETACPVCSGPMWDNRERKTNAKAPDFKCRDKSCSGVIWPRKAGDKPKQPEPEPPSYMDEEPPPSIDDLF